MKRERYLTTLLIICISSYFMMFSIGMTAEAEDIVSVINNNTISTTRKESVIKDLRTQYLNEKDLKNYILNLTQLSYEECNLIVQGSKNSNINPFIILGVLKRESNFDPYAVGIAGERGLGQLMENTAKPVAQNLGYEYDPEKLFEPKYNLELTITQLSYLYNIYDKDLNKTLTAYNRGQKGLADYIKAGKSQYKNLAMSDYSAAVLKFAYEFKEEFENLSK